MASSCQDHDVDIQPSLPVDPDLVCHVCSEQYKDPKLFPCGHTYCLQCIERLITESGINSEVLYESVAVGSGITSNPQVSVTCPECACEHPVPSKGPESFLTDYSVLQAIEAHTWQLCMQQKSSSCGVCETVGRTDAFCTDCSSFLCSYCSSAHKRMRTFSTHQVSPPDVSSLKFTPKPKVTFCPRHPKVAVNMYCVTCEETICNECLCSPVGQSVSSSLQLQYHFNHDVHPITDESVTLFEEKLARLVQRANKLQEALKQDWKDLDSQEEKVKVHPNKLRKAVNETVDSWIAAIEKTREKALNQIDERCAESIQLCQEEKQAVSSRMKSLESSLRFTDKALNCNSRSMKYSMMTQARCLLEPSLRDHQEQEIPSSCSFYQVKTPRRESSSLSLLVSSEQRLTTNRITRVELGEKSTVEISFKSKPSETPIFRVVFKGRSRHLCPLSACSRKEQCVWELEFTPHCIGKYQVEAQVFGKWISSQPFSTSPLSQLKIGDIVRVSPDAPDDLLCSKPREFEVGRIKSVDYTSSDSGRTINYRFEITWGHDSEKPVDKEFNFSFLRNSYNTFPLELSL